MKEHEARGYVAEAFAAANVSGLQSSDCASEILAMHNDIPLAEFHIDSLAVMEICISLEVNTGITITPAELATVLSIGELTTMLMERS